MRGVFGPSYFMITSTSLLVRRYETIAGYIVANRKSTTQVARITSYVCSISQEN